MAIPCEDSLDSEETLTKNQPEEEADKKLFLINDEKAMDRLLGLIDGNPASYLPDKTTTKEMWHFLTFQKLAWRRRS